MNEYLYTKINPSASNNIYIQSYKTKKHDINGKITKLSNS